MSTHPPDVVVLASAVVRCEDLRLGGPPQALRFLLASSLRLYLS